MAITVKNYLVTIIALCGFVTAIAQKKSTPSLRLGATVSFNLWHLASNNVGLGGIAGAEKRIGNFFAAEAEASYNYFIGDKSLYAGSKNKAFTIPVMAGIKAYPFPNMYFSLRSGAAFFQLNGMNSAEVRWIYGAAAGINLPQKSNRINVQLGYSEFPDNGIRRGYTTLATAIIIN